MLLSKTCVGFVALTAILAPTLAYQTRRLQEPQIATNFEDLNGLNVSMDFSQVQCAQIDSEVNYCGEKPDDATCTCGTCDQDKLELRSSGLYTCKHFSREDCAGLSPMRAFMDPTAPAADWFDCETLRCVPCPYESCTEHVPSGCLYDSSGTFADCLDDAESSSEDCPDILAAQFAVFRYTPLSPAGPDDGSVDCGHDEDPALSHGSYNVDYSAETMDPIEKCICEDCYITMSDHTNRLGGGGYAQYCNLHVCGDDGQVWDMSGGVAIKDDDASKTSAPEYFQTFKEIADKLGVSPEILAGVSLLALGLIVYYAVFHVFKGPVKESEEDLLSSSDEEGGDSDSSEGAD